MNDPKGTQRKQAAAWEAHVKRLDKLTARQARRTVAAAKRAQHTHRVPYAQR